MKHTEYLKYQFTEEELRDFAKDLARENAASAEAEEQKKAVVAQFTEKVASSKSKISQLSRYINNGYDHRSIDCSILMNTPFVGRKTIIRDDTGEIVKELVMSEQEKQETLPFAPKEDGKQASAND